MAQRKLVRRPAARRDLTEAVRFVRQEGGAAVSHRFLDETEATFTRLRSFPHLGTPWPTTRKELAGLRRRLIPHFPYSVFYLPSEAAIEIVRVLHNSRDIPTLLEDLSPE
jgi:toxin ParE1/3/4